MASATGSRRSFAGSRVGKNLWGKPAGLITDRFSAVIDDYDDCEVILDAHHVAAAIDGMVLYTGDYRHIVANRDLILSATHLHDVRYLGELTGGS